MTIDDTDKREVIAAFSPTLAIGNDIVDKLMTLKEIFNINTDDLFVNWETFNVSKVQEDLELNSINLDRFQEYLQSILANKTTPSSRKAREIQPSAMKRKLLMKSSPNVPSTPHTKRRKVDEETPYETPRVMTEDLSPSNYETANNTFQSPDSLTPRHDKTEKSSQSDVIETLNPNVSESKGFMDINDDTAMSIKPFKLTSNFDASKYKFRTMSMKLLESADVLDDQIESITSLYQSSMANKSEKEFGNPCLSSQFSILCCGRIVPDSPMYDQSASQCLNSAAICLETSRLHGIGQRIPLDITNLEEYSLFPGQIVVLKGKNPTGRSFVVEQIMPLPDLGASLTSSSELKVYEEWTSKGGLKILVAAGPFSNHHTLNYLKLEMLTEKINSEIKPHVVILNGPFIDMTNTSVQKGDFDFEESRQAPRNLDEVFKKLITPIIKKINSRIQVVLIPSLKDSCIKHCSYPMDSFDRKRFGLPKNVKVLPNPNNFSVNEVLFGISNLDVMKDLREIYKSADHSPNLPTNRFERVANHVFEQRRYYPVFPGSINQVRSPQKDALDGDLIDGIMQEELVTTSIGGSSLEVPYLGLGELGNSLPDVLILPSELRYFAKVIRGVVVINPGSFIKPHRDPNKMDGTYVIMSINAPDLSSNSSDNVEAVKDTDGLFFNNVHRRTRVSIYRN
ncbi:uncharacterized protein PRCAT00001581001 [Priceomyces carsonii]|uniref:uncharacterized protein n=1 Tax=Priceomyces carsonii TaxID=28549 RepID=UPI002ED9ADD3|nr:unnamed protein product [Priceomyces carsonii]